MGDYFDAVAKAFDDRYHLEAELGRGGMATVYRATDRKHQRPLALKVLRPELAVTLAAHLERVRRTSPCARTYSSEWARRNLFPIDKCRHEIRRSGR